MSRLDELIKNLCPDGVEYKTIGEIALDIYRGSGIKRDQVTAVGIPCVRYGEIYTTYGIWFENCKSHTQLEYVKSPKYFEHGDILFAITGESVEDIAKCCAYIGYEKCLAGGDIVVLKHNENPKYISYALSTVDAQRQKSAGKVKNKVVHSSVPSIKAIKIPVPPLEVQREIVCMLDRYTMLTNELTAKLTAELTARQKQYEYYRDKLLNFDVHGGATNDCDLLTLDELCIISSGGDVPKGKASKEKSDIYNIPIISNGIGNNAIYGYTDKAKITTPSVTISARGTIGYAEYRDYDFFPIVRLLVVTPKNTAKLNTKFLYYCLQRKKYFVPQSGIPQLTVPALKKEKIIVPALAIQKRIVKVLDNFTAICTDLKSGLPAEITKRQKQYEYYRDKLLSFQ